MGFGLLFGGLFLKMWRVDKIVNTTSLKRVKITNNDIARIGITTVIALTAYLGVISGAAGVYSKVTTTTDANQDTRMYLCAEKIVGFEIALFAVECFFILWGIRLCNATKNAPSVVNESQYIALATAIICALCIMVMPIIYLVGLSSVIDEVISAFAFTVCMFSTLCILFVPKVLQLYSGDEVDSKLKAHKVAARVYQETKAEENSLIRECSKALKSMSSLDEKHHLCVSQMEYWRTMLMAIDEKRSSGSGSGSASSGFVTFASNNFDTDPSNRIKSAASNGEASSFHAAEDGDMFENHNEFGEEA